MDAPDKIDDIDISRLHTEIGVQVRTLRTGKSWSRRRLSERTGISVRYLALVESGAANISIARLKRVADTFHVPISELIGSQDPFLKRMATTTDAERAAIRALLVDPPAHNGRIALIGLRGAGKSTLGPMLATALTLPFFELNDEIAKIAGLSVTEVFALYGQEGYRHLERRAIDRLGTAEPHVLAVAGGIVSDPETYSLLLSRFQTVWLKARPEDHMSRVRAQGDERPMADNPTAMIELRSILTNRDAHYARANHAVDTSGKTVRQSLDSLLVLLRRNQTLPSTR